MVPEASRDIATAPERPAAPEMPAGGAPEQAAEMSAETVAERARSAQRSREAVAEMVAPGGGAQAAPAPAAKDEYRQKVERVMEEGLGDVYGKLTPSQQQEFRSLGEETASKIRAMINETKFRVGAVLLLIRKWLLLIPGVDRFFLEQESKIKTDRIMNLASELREQREKQL